MASRFADTADFVIVYIEEMHTTDGWTFDSNPYRWDQPKTLEERLEAAKLLLDMKPTCPILVDYMTDEANLIYEALPDRLYILHNGLVKYKGLQGPYGYNLGDIEKYLQENSETQ